MAGAVNRFAYAGDLCDIACAKAMPQAALVVERAGWFLAPIAPEPAGEEWETPAGCAFRMEQNACAEAQTRKAELRFTIESVLTNWMEIASFAGNYKLHPDIDRELKWMGPMKELPPPPGSLPKSSKSRSA